MFLLALRGHQCGVQVDDQLPARRAGHRTPTRRDSFPGSSTSRPDRRNCGVDVAGQSENQPRHGGIRGHRPEHLRLGPGPPRCRRRSPHRARPRSPGRATPCQGHGPPDLNATAPTSLTAPDPADRVGASAATADLPGTRRRIRGLDREPASWTPLASVGGVQRVVGRVAPRHRSRCSTPRWLQRRVSGRDGDSDGVPPARAEWKRGPFVAVLHLA